LKALVTGGCGFIGSNLVDRLIERNHEVTVIDNLSSGKKNNVNDKANYIFEDLSKVLLNEKKYNFNPEEFDCVFHLAAMPRIQPSFDNPLYTIDNNAYGTALVCEMAKKYNLKVIYAGSSSFYGGVYLNPYSFSKWMGEEVCQMYSKVYGISSCVARFFNVYGPRHLRTGPYSTVIGIFEEQKRLDQSLTITGDGEQRRDFTHVYDICDALIKMSKDTHMCEIFNLGTGTNYSINEVAAMFNHRTSYIAKRPGEAKTTLADITKAKTILDWSPKYFLKDYIDIFSEGK